MEAMINEEALEKASAYFAKRKKEADERQSLRDEMIHAVCVCDKQLMDRCLARGFNPNMFISDTVATDAGHTSSNELSDFVALYPKSLKYLLDQKAFDQKNLDYILHTTCHAHFYPENRTAQQVKSAELLLKNGANPNAVFRYYSQLRLVIQCGTHEVANILLGNGADPYEKGHFVLLRFGSQNPTQTAKNLIEWAEINDQPEMAMLIKERQTIIKHKAPALDRSQKVKS